MGRGGVAHLRRLDGDGGSIFSAGLWRQHLHRAHRDDAAWLLSFSRHRLGARAPVNQESVFSNQCSVIGNRKAFFLTTDYRLLAPEARSAALIRCGVAGISSIATPNGDSASLTALMIAAGAPIVPPSPRPLAPVTDDAAGDSTWCNSIGGISLLVGGK